MTRPALTREECQRLSGLLRLGLAAGRYGVQYEDFQKIADLVESYPLPPEDGERVDLSNRALRHATAIQVAHGPTARVLRECAAALLRQPPRGGVSKEAVLAILRSDMCTCGHPRKVHQPTPYARPCYDCAGCRGFKAEDPIGAVEALPEPEPPAPLAGVSKEAVVALVKQFGSEALTDAPAPGLRPMTGYDFTQAAGRLVSDIEALPEAAPRPAEHCELLESMLTPLSMLMERLDRSKEPRVLARVVDLSRAVEAALLEKPPAAPPSGVDRACRALPEDDGWRYLPELPADGPTREFWCWSNGFPGTLSPEIRGYASAAIDAARWAAAGIYCWKPAGEPPPLPETKP